MTTPAITVRIAFVSNPLDTVPTWVDVSTDVMKVEIQRGRSYEMGRMETGTAKIQLLNTSGDYWNIGGAHAGYVLPMKKVNIRVTWGGTTYDRYTGYAESWTPQYLLPPDDAPVMVLQCTDYTKNLSRGNINYGAGGMPSSLSGERILNILDFFSWPLAWEDLDTGQSYVPYLTLPFNDNAIEYINSIVDAELGAFFIAPDGKATFQDRHHREYITSSAGTFGDGAADMNCYSILMTMDDKYIHNDIQITCDTETYPGATMQQATDDASITAYGIHTLAKTDVQLVDNTDSLNEAIYLLAKYKDAAMRVSEITIRPKPGQMSTIYPITLASEISSRFHIHVTPAGINSDYFVDGISEKWEATMPGIWETKYQLTAVPTAAWWLLDQSALGTETVIGF
jgi:hypothetical protein